MSDQDLSVIAKYFVNLYYNVFYEEAVARRDNKSFPSITEAYKTIALMFPKSVKDDSFYVKILDNLHKFFITQRSFVTFRDFVIKVSNYFVPQDYRDRIHHEKRIGVIHVVLSNISDEFARTVLTSHLSPVIDYHSNKEENCQNMYNDVIHLIEVEQNKMYHRFILPKTRDSTVIESKVLENRLMALQEQYDTFKSRVSGELKKISAVRQRFMNDIKGLRQVILQQRSQISELKDELKRAHDSLAKSHSDKQSDNSHCDTSQSDTSHGDKTLPSDEVSLKDVEKAFALVPQSIDVPPKNRVVEDDLKLDLDEEPEKEDAKIDEKPKEQNINLDEKSEKEDIKSNEQSIPSVPKDGSETSTQTFKIKVIDDEQPKKKRSGHKKDK